MSGGTVRRVALILLIPAAVGFGAIGTSFLLTYYLLALEGGLPNPLPPSLPRLPSHRVAVEVGVLRTAFMASRAVAAAASSSAAVLGAATVLAVGSALYATAIIGYYFSRSFAELVAFRAVQGVGSGLLWPTAEVALLQSVPSEWRTRALSLYMSVAGLAQTFAPAVAAAAYAAARSLACCSPTSVLATAILMFLPFPLLALAASLALRRLRVKPHPRRGGGAGLSWRSRLLILFYAEGLVGGIVGGILMGVTQLYIMEYVVGAVAAVAAIVTVAGLAGLIVGYPAAHIADKASWRTRLAMLVAAGVGRGVCLSLIPLARDPATLTLVFAAATAFASIFGPILRATEAGLVSEAELPKVMAAHQTSFNIGMIVGPLVGGFAYEALYSTRILGLPGVAVIFIAAGAATSIAVAPLAVALRRVRMGEALSLN